MARMDGEMALLALLLLNPSLLVGQPITEPVVEGRRTATLMVPQPLGTLEATKVAADTRASNRPLADNPTHMVTSSLLMVISSQRMVISQRMEISRRTGTAAITGALISPALLSTAAATTASQHTGTRSIKRPDTVRLPTAPLRSGKEDRRPMIPGSMVGMEDRMDNRTRATTDLHTELGPLSMVTLTGRHRLITRRLINMAGAATTTMVLLAGTDTKFGLD